MNLRVVTTNEQQGDQSVETVKVYDGDQLIADINKTGADLAEVKVFEAFKPDLAGAVVFIEEGASVPDGEARQAVLSANQRPPKKAHKLSIGE